MSRWKLVSALLPAALLIASATACGPDRGDRGLQPKDETAVPATQREMADTAAERERQVTEGIQDGELEDRE